MSSNETDRIIRGMVAKSGPGRRLLEDNGVVVDLSTKQGERGMDVASGLFQSVVNLDVEEGTRSHARQQEVIAKYGPHFGAPAVAHELDQAMLGGRGVPLTDIG